MKAIGKLALLLLGLSALGGWNPNAHALAQLRAAQEPPAKLLVPASTGDHVGAVRGAVTRPLAPAHARLPGASGAFRIAPYATLELARRFSKPARTRDRARRDAVDASVRRLRLPPRSSADDPEG